LKQRRARVTSSAKELKKMNNTDIFDKFFSLPIFKLFFPFYKKHKEPLLYLFFGVLTTVVSILVFWIFTAVIPTNELIGNIISWIFAVLFAFITNRKWVFTSHKKQNLFSEGIKFYSGRILTLIIEEIIIFIFITLLHFNSLTVKITAQVIIIILNYVISKIFVFKNKA